MGAFAAAFAAALMVGQTTLLLLYAYDDAYDVREALWTFYTVRRAREGVEWRPVPAWGHAAQRVDVVLDAWNPHLILHALCCVHLVICLSRAQRKASALPPAPPSWYQYSLTHLLRLGWVLPALGLLTTVVGVLGVLQSADTLRYPTILTVAALYAGAAWYAYLFDGKTDDMAWTLAVHMQLVSVPLTVLAFAAMGVRFWTDVVLHAALLSAAVNALWLQQPGPATAALDPWARQAVRLITLALPLFSLFAAQAQWGGDGWEHLTGVTAAISLLPLVILTVLAPQQQPDGTAWGKVQLRVAHMCISVALLSLVINLATMT